MPLFFHPSQYHIHIQALHHRALSGTKYVIEQYDDKVVECINFLVNTEELSREEKTVFVKKARKALGQTALLLSGGGSISMYHAGESRPGRRGVEGFFFFYFRLDGRHKRDVCWNKQAGSIIPSSSY